MPFQHQAPGLVSMTRICLVDDEESGWLLLSFCLCISVHENIQFCVVFTAAHLQYEIRDDVAVIKFDTPNSKVKHDNICISDRKLTIAPVVRCNCVSKTLFRPETLWWGLYKENSWISLILWFKLCFPGERAEQGCDGRIPRCHEKAERWQSRPGGCSRLGKGWHLYRRSGRVVSEASCPGNNGEFSFCRSGS